MYYKSWKKLTDKVYLLGGINEKEKPRTFVTELLREAEKEFVRTGVEEGVYLATPTESSIHLGTNTSEIQLPSHIGIIKTVQLNGEPLPRFNSGEILLNAENEPEVGPPTAWNMLGENVLIFDQKLTSSDNVAVFYESSVPQEDLLVKAYAVDYVNSVIKSFVYVEPVADTEFKNYWGAQPVRMFIQNTSGAVLAPANSASNEWDTTIYTGDKTNITSEISPPEQSSENNTWETFGFKGSYQKVKVTTGDPGSTVTVGASHLSLLNYNTNYGPTIRKEHQDYLPYYALGLLLQPVDPNMADYYLNKWAEYILFIESRYQDNDLKGQIETTVRSTWRY